MMIAITIDKFFSGRSLETYLLTKRKPRLNCSSRKESVLYTMSASATTSTPEHSRSRIPAGLRLWTVTYLIGSSQTADRLVDSHAIPVLVIALLA